VVETLGGVIVRRDFFALNSGSKFRMTVEYNWGVVYNDARSTLLDRNEQLRSSTSRNSLCSPQLRPESLWLFQRWGLGEQGWEPR
jgi:hypothetical protein